MISYMKLIIHYAKSETDIIRAYHCLQSAIKSGIKEGRQNFKSYYYYKDKTQISICKNKKSYTIYVEDGKA